MEKIPIKDTNNNYIHCPYLRNYFFNGLTNTDLKLLSGIIDYTHLKNAGDQLCSTNKDINFLYIVCTGSLKDLYTTIEGKELIKDFYLPGDIIGFDALNQHHYFSTIITLETSNLYTISLDKFFEISYKIPSLQNRFIYLMSKKLQDRMIHDLSQKNDAIKRLTLFLFNISTRYNKHDFTLTMSREEIGNFLNMTTETVSRMFSKLKKMGYLSIRKKNIRIINIKELILKFNLNAFITTNI